MEMTPETILEKRLEIWANFYRENRSESYGLGYGSESIERKILMGGGTAEIGYYSFPRLGTENNLVAEEVESWFQNLVSMGENYTLYATALRLRLLAGPYVPTTELIRILHKKTQSEKWNISVRTFEERARYAKIYLFGMLREPKPFHSLDNIHYLTPRQKAL